MLAVVYDYVFPFITVGVNNYESFYSNSEAHKMSNRHIPIANLTLYQGVNYVGIKLYVKLPLRIITSNPI
jgi:hypothetical protein